MAPGRQREGTKGRGTSQQRPAPASVPTTAAGPSAGAAQRKHSKSKKAKKSKKGTRRPSGAGSAQRPEDGAPDLAGACAAVQLPELPTLSTLRRFGLAPAVAPRPALDAAVSATRTAADVAPPPPPPPLPAQPSAEAPPAALPVAQQATQAAQGAAAAPAQQAEAPQHEVVHVCVPTRHAPPLPGGSPGTPRSQRLLGFASPGPGGTDADAEAGGGLESVASGSSLAGLADLERLVEEKHQQVTTESSEPRRPHEARGSHVLRITRGAPQLVSAGLLPATDPAQPQRPSAAAGATGGRAAGPSSPPPWPPALPATATLASVWADLLAVPPLARRGSAGGSPASSTSSSRWSWAAELRSLGIR